MTEAQEFDWRKSRRGERAPGTSEHDDADAERLYLNPAVQGVNIPVHLPGPLTVRAVVSVEVLKAHFGAGDSSADWLRVARGNAGLLQWLLQMQYAANPTLPLVLTCISVEQHLRGERTRAEAQAGQGSNGTDHKVTLASAPDRLIPSAPGRRPPTSAA